MYQFGKKEMWIIFKDVTT